MSASPGSLGGALGSPASPQSKPQALRLSSRRAARALHAAQRMQVSLSPGADPEPLPASGCALSVNCIMLNRQGRLLGQCLFVSARLCLNRR